MYAPELMAARRRPAVPAFRTHGFAGTIAA
jgi:hypothetical protein